VGGSRIPIDSSRRHWALHELVTRSERRRGTESFLVGARSRPQSDVDPAAIVDLPQPTQPAVDLVAVDGAQPHVASAGGVVLVAGATVEDPLIVMPSTRIDVPPQPSAACRQWRILMPEGV